MLILASSSPRRHELLAAAGLEHVIRAPNVPEIRAAEESPEEFVRRLAREKAWAIEQTPGDVILAADTIVCLRDEVLGKPSGSDDAIGMLRLLSGETHFVLTGICLRWQSPSRSHEVVDVAQTEVTFLSLSESEIRDYVASGEPFDKAGGYAIQGLASKFIASIRGSYQNVVGLPVSLVYSRLKEI